MRLAALPCIVRDVEPVALVLTGVRGLVSWAAFLHITGVRGGGGGRGGRKCALSPMLCSAPQFWKAGCGRKHLNHTSNHVQQISGVELSGVRWKYVAQPDRHNYQGGGGTHLSFDIVI